MENPSSSSSSSSSSSPNSSTSSNNSTSNNGVVGVGVGVGASLPPTPPPPLTPKPSPIPPPPHSSSPYPTTFVQADTQSFKQMVQLLTGSAETTGSKRQSAQPKNPIPPLNRPSTRKPAFKLHERRPSMKNLMMISPFDLSGPTMNRTSPSSARTPLSPSVLDFPSLALSPVTPLIPDPFDRVPNPNPNPDAAAAAAEEERAIAEKGFYLHPSPRPAAPREAEPPRLLPLFPVTSPRGSSA